MSSLDRSLSGPYLTFQLSEQLREMRADEAYQHGRVGRTLARSGRLRVTLVAMASGNIIHTHQADSPMTLHVLEGHIRFRAGGEDHELREGGLIFFGPGDANDMRAMEESALLLTFSALGDDHAPDRIL